MALIRETIFAALQTRLSSSLSPVKVSRRVRMWTEVPPSEQPAVFIDQGDQKAAGDYGKPSKWVLNAAIYVYVNDTSEAGPATTMNNLISSIETALERQPGESGASHGPTTLGGIVNSCRVVGVTDSGGSMGDQGVAVIDVEVEAVA